jgi:hypothetical protein
MSKFKVGDKVQRKDGMRYEEDQKIGYTDAILTIEHIRTDGTLKFVEDKSTTHYCQAYYSLVVSNTEPDISKFGWLIRYENLAQYKLIMGWLNARGYGWEYPSGTTQFGRVSGALTNVYNSSFEINGFVLQHLGDTVYHNGRNRHEIKFNFDVIIRNVELPDVEHTEREKEIDELRQQQRKIEDRLRELEDME